MPGKLPTEPGTLSYEYVSKRISVKAMVVFPISREKNYNTSNYKFVSKVKYQARYYQEIMPENHRDNDKFMYIWGQSMAREKHAD